MISSNDGILEQIVESYKVLKRMSDENPDVVKKLDENYWIYESMKDIYEMCIDYNQTDYEVDEEIGYKEVVKVIRLLTPFPSEFAAAYKLDTTFLNGYWIATPGLIIGEHDNNSYFKKKVRYKQRVDPSSDLGYPDNYDYSTYQSLPNGCGFVLKHSIVSEYVNSSSKYQYLYLGE